MNWDAVFDDVKERCAQYIDQELTPGEFAKLWRDLKDDVDLLLTDEQKQLNGKMRSIYTSGQPLTDDQKAAESIFQYLIEKHLHFWAIHQHWWNATVSGILSREQIEQFITLRTLIETDSISEAEARRVAKQISRSNPRPGTGTGTDADTKPRKSKKKSSKKAKRS